MADHVFVVSEWIHKENCEELKNESGCIGTHATRKISHPGAPGKSKYKIIILREYVDTRSFNSHCQADSVKSDFKKYIDNEETAKVKAWTVRLFRK